MKKEQQKWFEVKYRVFVGCTEDLILFQEALSNSKLPIDRKNMYLDIRSHSGSNHAEIGILSEEFYHLFISTFRYSGLFQKWAGTLAKIS